jgi:hypothetical protein
MRQPFLAEASVEAALARMETPPAETHTRAMRGTETSVPSAARDTGHVPSTMSANKPEITCIFFLDKTEGKMNKDSPLNYKNVHMRTRQNKTNKRKQQQQQQQQQQQEQQEHKHARTWKCREQSFSLFFIFFVHSFFLPLPTDNLITNHNPISTQFIQR